MGQRLVRTSRGTAGLWGTSVSGNALELLGARAMMGRTLTPADDHESRRGRPELRHVAAVTSMAIPNIVGRAIEFRAGGISQAAPRMLTVVGVMPPSFQLRRRLHDADRVRRDPVHGRRRTTAVRRDDDRPARARRHGRRRDAGSQRHRRRDSSTATGRCAAAARTAFRADRHEGSAREAGAAGAARAARRGRRDAADRLRQRREPAARARHHAPARDRGSRRHRREPRRASSG